MPQGAEMILPGHPILDSMAIALGAFIVTWSVGFFVRLLNTPVKLYHEQKDDVSKLTAELETVILRRREIEAHSSLLKEQLDESRRQNSPLQRVAREQQGQQIKAALDPEFQKQGWLMALTREYISSHHNVSSAIVTGTELPHTASWPSTATIEEKLAAVMVARTGRSQCQDAPVSTRKRRSFSKSALKR
jgi:hypothetical protein